jgi:uncharacterized protein
MLEPIAAVTCTPLSVLATKPKGKARKKIYGTSGRMPSSRPRQYSGSTATEAQPAMNRFTVSASGNSVPRPGFSSHGNIKERNMAKQDNNRSQSQSHGGRSSGGSSKSDSERGSEAGRKGSEASGGSFKDDPHRASEAGKKGGQK